MPVQVIAQQLAELGGHFQPGNVASGQGVADDIGQGVLQRVDRPPGAQVVGAVDDKDRDAEGLAGGDQGGLVPGLPQFGPDVS
jgi:hypothetical protein